jgi:hypothetical protein
VSALPVMRMCSLAGLNATARMSESCAWFLTDGSCGDLVSHLRYTIISHRVDTSKDNTDIISILSSPTEAKTFSLVACQSTSYLISGSVI